MLDWKNQSIDLLNQGDFQIVEPGPLHVPIEGFAIRRDENLALTLETKAARTAKSRAVQHPSGMVTLNSEQVELANISGIKAVLSGVQTRSVSTLQDGPRLSGLKEIAGIHQLTVTPGDPEKAAYTIEWLENLPVSPFTGPTPSASRRKRPPSGALRFPRMASPFPTPIAVAASTTPPPDLRWRVMRSMSARSAS